MRATAGDGLLVRGHRVDEADREGVIIAVHGQDGSPPYLVRWNDGRESVFVPSSDATVEHFPATRPADSTE